MEDLVQIQNTSDLAFDQGALHTDGRGYYVYTTMACNLRCSYCFVSDKQNNDHMPDDMVDSVIDFIVNDPCGRKNKYIHFFGGEPLIKAAVIWKMCENIRKRAPEECKLKWGITTNGTLLTEDICKNLKKYEIGVQLSLDGSQEGNDVHRQVMGGTQVGLPPSGAFHLVQIDNYLKYFGTNARMTVTVHNLRFLAKSLRELYERGFRSYSVIPDTDCGPWEGHWDEFQEELYKVWWFWYEHRKDVQVNIISQVLDKMTSDRQVPGHLCNAGRNVLGIGVNGDIWPCHDFLGKFRTTPSEVQKLLIGNVRKGWTDNVKMFENLKIVDGNVRSGAGYDCDKCFAAYACDRGCPYVNYANTGDIRTVNPTYCRFTRMYGDMALKFMSLMRDEYILKPRKAVEGKLVVTSHDEIWREVAARFFQNTAPYGKSRNGKALMPGSTTMRHLGWQDLQAKFELSKNKAPDDVNKPVSAIQFKQVSAKDDPDTTIRFKQVSATEFRNGALRVALKPRE